MQGKTEVDILATTCGQTRPVKHGEPWFEVTYRPVDHNDTSWITGITRTSAYQYTINSDYTKAADAAYPFMASITLGAAASQNIQWEFWAIVEYAGPTVTGKTLTPPDLQGWASVIAAHSQFDEMHATINTRQEQQQTSYNTAAIKSYATQLLEAAAPYLKTGAAMAGQALLRRLAAPRLPQIRYR